MKEKNRGSRASGSSQAAANYAVCASCHGALGGKSALGKSKVIAWMSKDDLLTALVGYKEKKYGGSMRGIMKAQVMRYSVEELNDLANFIASM